MLPLIIILIGIGFLIFGFWWGWLILGVGIITQILGLILLRKDPRWKEAKDLAKDRILKIVRFIKKPFIK